MSYLPKKKYDIEMQNIQTLGQRWAGKEHDLPIHDYACNVYADKIAILDVYMLLYEDIDPGFVKDLGELRQRLVGLGTALWIKNSDVLTNLSVRVGKTGITELPGKR